MEVGLFWTPCHSSTSLIYMRHCAEYRKTNVVKLGLIDGESLLLKP